MKQNKITDNLFDLTKSITNSHNECDDCGETIKPDQWSKDIREQVFLCIDCA